jgi:Papain fold toxin 2
MNGRHEGISILVNEIEMVFDNHHPNGIPKNQWIINLQFYGKIHHRNDFQITVEIF